MKTFAIVLMGLLFFHGPLAHAQYDDGFDVDVDDSSDGNDIPEPVLADYVKGSRTPGFSNVYDIVSDQKADRTPGLSVAYDIVTPDQVN